MYCYASWQNGQPWIRTFPVDTGRKLNVHETFRRLPGRFWTSYVRSIYVLCLRGLSYIRSKLWHGISSHKNKIDSISEFKLGDLICANDLCLFTKYWMFVVSKKKKKKKLYKNTYVSRKIRIGNKFWLPKVNIFSFR